MRDTVFIEAPFVRPFISPLALDFTTSFVPSLNTQINSILEHTEPEESLTKRLISYSSSAAAIIIFAKAAEGASPILTVPLPIVTPPQLIAPPVIAAAFPSIFTADEPDAIARSCGGCLGLSCGSKGSPTLAAAAGEPSKLTVGDPAITGVGGKPSCSVP